MKKELILISENDTFLLGKKIASFLPHGGFIALYGDLGTGKSVFARGVADFLGVINITSPTFTILQRYDTEPVLYHIDAYRLSSGDELYDIGFEECLKTRSLVVMEWADIVSDVLPRVRLDVFLRGNGMDPRTALIDCKDASITEEQWMAL